jgi:hypothetical protein
MYWKEIKWKRLGPKVVAVSSFFCELTEDTHKYFRYHVRILAKNRTEYQKYTSSTHKNLHAFPLRVDVFVGYGHPAGNRISPVLFTFHYIC